MSEERAGVDEVQLEEPKVITLNNGNGLVIQITENDEFIVNQNVTGNEQGMFQAFKHFLKPHMERQDGESGSTVSEASTEEATGE